MNLRQNHAAEISPSRQNIRDLHQGRDHHISIPHQNNVSHSNVNNIREAISQNLQQRMNAQQPNCNQLSSNHNSPRVIQQTLNNNGNNNNNNSSNNNSTVNNSSNASRSPSVHNSPVKRIRPKAPVKPTAPAPPPIKDNYCP